MRSGSRWLTYQPTLLCSRTAARRRFRLHRFLHPGRPAISDCPRPRVVHALPSQEEARTHLACGGLDGAGPDGVGGGGLVLERPRDRGDLFALAELCLLLGPCLALLPGLARHAVDGEGWADDEPLLASQASRMQPTTSSTPWRGDWETETRPAAAQIGRAHV